MPIKVISEPKAEDYILELSGRLEGLEDYPSIGIEDLQAINRVIFECDKLDWVNSFGAQKWLLWMRQFSDMQHFIFRDVQPRVLDLFSVVVGFLPKNSVIESALLNNLSRHFSMVWFFCISFWELTFNCFIIKKA